VTGCDWADLDEDALDSYATARTLSRLGDDRYGTATDALFDEDAEVWPPLLPSDSPPRKAEDKNRRA
jgi:hypothetical protein